MQAEDQVVEIPAIKLDESLGARCTENSIQHQDSREGWI